MKRSTTRFAGAKKADVVSVGLVSAPWSSLFATPDSSCGDRIRTCDLEVMSLASYRTAPPRVIVDGILTATLPNPKGASLRYCRPQMDPNLTISPAVGDASCL